METVSMFIDGRDHAAVGNQWFDSDDPFAGKPWGRVARGGVADVDLAVAAAGRAFRSGPWVEPTATQRGAWARRLGDVIADNAERLADLEVRDNGKLYAEMYGQVSHRPEWYRYDGGMTDELGAEVGSPLVEHLDVRKISFTGSDATGKVIGRSVAAESKHVGLEPGGKSPTQFDKVLDHIATARDEGACAVLGGGPATRPECGDGWSVDIGRAFSFMAPFGGVKDSGIGRENGMAAIGEYLQTKTVWINTGATTGNPFVLR